MTETAIEKPQQAPEFERQKILAEVAQACINLLLKGDPFFAHLVSTLNRQVVTDDKNYPSVAIGLSSGGTFTLYVNADYWQNRLAAPEQRRGILKHEMLHMVFKHLRVNEPTLDRRLMNVAFDMVVNQYVDKNLLPPESIFIESFPELRLPRGQTWFYYYKKLEEFAQKMGNTPDAGGQAGQMLSTIGDDTHGLERHKPWQDIQNRNELDSKVLDTHLENLLKIARQRTSDHAWGNVPGDIQDLIGKMLAQPVPEMDWRLMVKLFSESAYKTNIKNTLKRPSKRYGTTPGIKVRRKQRLLVAVDTSGSIAQADLDMFFAEIFHLWRTGAEVDVVECDTKILRQYPFRGQTPTAVWGRGGTDFNEPLELANRERPDGLIYFTDGHASTPKVVPRVPVLWVVTKQGIPTDNYTYNALPGKKVKMKN